MAHYVRELFVVIEVKGNMIEFNATIFVQMANFFVFFLIMNAIFFKPLVKNIQERRNYISDSEKKITESLAKLEEAEKKNREEIDAARLKAQELVNKHIASAEEEKAKVIKAAQEETRQIFDEFCKELAEETAKAKAQLISEVDMLANDIATKILA